MTKRKGYAEAVYNSGGVTLADGDEVGLFVDGSGNLLTSMGATIAGEDLTNDVLKVRIPGSYFQISSATTTVVKATAGYINSIICVGGTLGAVTVYDNTAASGAVIVPTVTPVAGGVLIKNVSFSTGLTILTAAATVITGSYV